MDKIIKMPESLRYSRDNENGIIRIKNKAGFSYLHHDKTLIENPQTLERIGALGLPPAYRDVWICKDDSGHLQATGLDEKGRKQYRYHADWTDFRARQKFRQIVAFGTALPSIRRRITRDLRGDDANKNFVCAALLRLIDRAALRAGHASYNATGATTLKRRHISLASHGLRLDFTAKGGKRVRKTIKDRTLAKVLQEIDDLPGRDLFQYIGVDGEVYNLDSGDANAYLRDDFTLKTFRTWHGSVAAFGHALNDSKPTIKAMSEAAAERLHNTPAICRSSYIHPDIIDLSKGHDTKSYKDQKTPGLRKTERLMLAYLQG
ncbi:DNA topoisomerase IB [Fretibacter rubidus]|uniref:DNA topoisomerase IB n=1 Tax=Fretibacter rubidus TaxID=570162 RepID=UPI00352AB5F6